MVSTSSTWPARVHRAEEALRRFGDLPPRLLPYLDQGDPLADAAVEALAELQRAERRALIEKALATIPAGETPPPLPPPLAELIAGACRVPPWVDWARIERAGAVFRRAGLLGGATLGLSSLVYGYAAPAGNKPLAFSGRLTERADRRLAETGHFVTAVCAPGGTAPGAPGWQISLQVRLMHAQVRRLLLRDERWSNELWSLPINQHDMMATVLLFSMVFVDGVRKLGLRVSEAEADDYQHLWRWVGTLLGVAPELLPATYGEAVRLGEFVHLTQGPPDADSRALVRALLDGPRRRIGPRPPEANGDRRALRRWRAARRLAEAHVAAATALSRYLVGDELADALGLERTHRRLPRGVRSVVQLLDGIRRTSPRLERAAERLGERYWDFSVAQGLGGLPATYGLPERLSRSVP